MKDRKTTAQLPEDLEFRIKKWWDPVPIWIINQLEEKELAQLATVQLKFERSVLESQLRANEEALAIVNNMAK